MKFNEYNLFSEIFYISSPPGRNPHNAHATINPVKYLLSIYQKYKFVFVQIAKKNKYIIFQK